MVAVAISVGVLYAIGIRRLARRGRSWSPARWIPFAAGVIVLAIAAVLPETSFSWHMTQHVLLGMVAPILLALGAPITLALQASSRPTTTTLLRVLHGRAWSTLTHPIVGWTLFGGTLVAYYLSPLFEQSLQHSWLHAVVHVHFLLVGCLFLWVLVGVDVMPRPLPHGARLLAVLVAVPFHAFLGVALLSTTTPLAPNVYPSLEDQHAAAGILWASGEVLTLVIAAIVYAQWWAAEQRESVRLDRRLTTSHP
ncbi:MAG TPA: cytochrome c oxidase assembly protein [Acidimicrobiales bacterium]|jgi:putative copper resistance protein D|nr:cytochrome c oxidase assembly protein [Acidimicrobiales bacterium]